MYNHAIYDRLEPWFRRFESGDGIDERVREYEDHAVAIGYDEITESALPVLEEEFGDVVIIDRKTDHVKQLEEEGRYDYVFGDFRHSEVRKAAGLKKAKFVLSSTVQREVNEALLDEVREDAMVFVEAERIEDARALYDMGAAYVVIDTHLSSEQLSQYLRLYVTDCDALTEAIETDIERIRRKARRLAAQERSSFEFDFDPRRMGENDD